MSRLVFFSSSWASGEIRARQIASYLNQPVDILIDELKEDDVCVCVKFIPNEVITKRVKKCYVDIVDSYGSLYNLKDRNDLGVIAIGKSANTCISNYLDRKDVVIIPEHHCNFERATIEVDKPKTVGLICYPECFHLEVDKVTLALNALGLQFKICTEFSNRLDVCNFYKTIDIQLTFRFTSEYSELKNPLKVVNAGSFGIPSVCYPEPAYVQEGVRFMAAATFEEAIGWCKLLSNDIAYYKNASVAALEDAEEYHISKIAPLYEGLLL